MRNNADTVAQRRQAVEHAAALVEPQRQDLGSAGGEQPVIVIRASTSWVSLNLGEVWAYRQLLYYLVWRDVKVRYKQTAIGASWAVLQPVFSMVVFSLFFGGLAGIPSDGVPYPVFALAALVPWTFFANGLINSSNSLVTNKELITKIYFPRLVIPLASVLSGLVDFVLAFLILLLVMIGFGIVPTASILLLPALVVLALVTALGAGLWLTALNVQYRDVQYVVPFMTQAWLFITPIVYPSSLLSEPWRSIYGINPMAGVVEGFRWALLGTETAPGLMILVSSVAALTLLAGGAYYFRRMERLFADVI